MKPLLVEKNDIKIFILFLMNNVGYPLDFSSINDIVIQDGVVNYFDFADCFAELLDTGNIKEIKDENEECLYEITKQGKEVADNLQTDIRPLILEKSLKSALQLLSFRKRGARLDTDVVKNENGTYTLTCLIFEQDREIMKVSINLDNLKQVDKMKSNFINKPEIVYRGIISVLSGDINYLLS